MSQAGRAILCLLLLGAMVLSGCSGSNDTTKSSTAPKASSTSTAPKGGGGGGGGTVTGTTSQSGGGGGGGGGGSSDNKAPELKFSASIQNGAIPLNVTFTIKGTDPESAKLGYTLKFGDGTDDAAKASQASGFTATESHSYTTGGLYNATLTLSDGTNTVNAHLLINATAAATSSGVTFTCTAAIGAVVGGGLTTGPVISGCDFVTLDRRMLLVSDDLPLGPAGGPGGCFGGADTNGDGNSSTTTGDEPYAVGSVYEAPATLNMACGPAEAQSQGSITMSPA